MILNQLSVVLWRWISQRTMQKTVLINCFFCLMVFVTSVSFAQSALEVSYSDVYIGRNMNVSLKKEIADFSVSAGLCYHINRAELVPYFQFIKKSALATHFGERLGFQVGAEYAVLKNAFCKLNLFYNNQFFFMKQLHKAYYVVGQLAPDPQTEADFVYTKHEKVFGPVFTSENVVGLSVHCGLTNKMYLLAKGGFGMIFWKNTDDSALILANKRFNQGINYTSFFSIGLGYSLK